jgi:hypothetical protein
MAPRYPPVIPVHKKKITRVVKKRRQTKAVKLEKPKRSKLSRLRRISGKRAIARIDAIDSAYKKELLELNQMIKELKDPAVRKKLEAGQLPDEWKTPAFREFLRKELQKPKLWFHVKGGAFTGSVIGGASKPYMDFSIADKTKTFREGWPEAWHRYWNEGAAGLPHFFSDETTQKAFLAAFLVGVGAGLGTASIRAAADRRQQLHDRGLDERNIRRIAEKTRRNKDLLAEERDAYIRYHVRAMPTQSQLDRAIRFFEWRKKDAITTHNLEVKRLLARTNKKTVVYKPREGLVKLKMKKRPKPTEVRVPWG